MATLFSLTLQITTYKLMPQTQRSRCIKKGIERCLPSFVYLTCLTLPIYSYQPSICFTSSRIFHAITITVFHAVDLPDTKPSAIYNYNATCVLQQGQRLDGDNISLTTSVLYMRVTFLADEREAFETKGHQIMVFKLEDKSIRFQGLTQLPLLSCFMIYP